MLFSYAAPASRAKDYWTGLIDELEDAPCALRITADAAGPHSVGFVRDSSRAKLLQIHVSAGVQSVLQLGTQALRSGFSSIELNIEEGASLKLSVNPTGYAGIADFLRIHADVAKNASLSVHTSGKLSQQSSQSRVEWLVHLNGQGATADLSSLEELTGDHQKSHYLQLFHHAPETSSSQNFRFILGGEAKASFHGGVKIDQGAKQAAAEQLNKNLLLSDDAEVYTRPELQIEEDEVTCSHGATVADLDAGKDFYLRSRGITPTDARRFLVRAFGQAVVPDWVKSLESGVK